MAGEQPIKIMSHRQTLRYWGFVIVVLIVAITIIAAMLFTVLFNNAGQFKWPLSFGSSASTSMNKPPPRLPPPNLTLIPPLDQYFALSGKPPFTTPTPCPTVVLPTTVIGTPSPNRTVTASPTSSALPPIATVPACGNGLVYGPKCYTILPGQNPTQDQIRQELYSVSQEKGILFPLIEAISWQESGWQENVQACDGGVGVMQIQPETNTWLNHQFGTNYSSTDLHGNIELGVTLIKWLLEYYVPFCNTGLPTGQVCTGTTVWPGASDRATLRMIIVSAYNEGVGTMAHYGIINWNYVNNVLSFYQQFNVAG